MTTTQPSGHPTSEPDDREEELMQRIGAVLLEVAPEGWRRIDLLVKLNAKVHDFELAVYLEDGGTAEVIPHEGITKLFAELRRLGYAPGRGTWFAARLTLDAPGRLDISYNMDHDPLWEPPIPAEFWARDLEVFPRDDAFVPDWLRAKLDEAGDEEQKA
ncbi:hypothetical protein [Umezawaea sp. Da 62-37]|uniref:hypothetical protein n=1 Tax=Umezawaea sp. Da 62-37 TaxID=3075927 RepID=UPI0028F70B52|nr:hypothetical protein [Umezawaea sp. Da 62-37]WNV90763.1 hypothetical protein RM788_21520 [Umezawaea sp. Da 62-37]